MPYKFLNVNPNDDLYAEDCVTRAITVAVGLKYDAVQHLLDITHYFYHCPKLCLACYKHLLSDILCYKMFKDKYRHTVEEIATMYRDKKVIIRIDGHLTCGMYGIVVDSFDCSKELVDCFWIIE